MDASKALLRLKDLCDRGEYCSSEILQKLRNWGVGDNDSRKILAVLERERYVDDERFAKAFCHTKAINSHWGKVKIRLHMIKKRIPAVLISKALDEIDEDEYYDCLRSVLQSKKRQLGSDADTFEGRTKIFRYAVTRGYEPGMVSDMIKSRDY